MESIKELYRIGHGPSSSHTMGPRSAATKFLNKYPQADSYRVTLYGSLASTGKGHLTDVALKECFGSKNLEIIWQPDTILPFHPNGMLFEALDGSQNILGTWQVFSIGGGALSEGDQESSEHHLYKYNSFNEILLHSERTGQALWELVEHTEGPGIWDYLNLVWHTMKSAITRGLNQEGVLPGDLGLARKAWVFHRKAILSGDYLRKRGTVSSYALAVAEENAAGGEIVTAPTCGSCGVLPAVLLFTQETTQCSDQAILRALATAGLVGTLIKHNASISGAEVGCQGEIGSACSMAAAAVTQLLGGNIRQIEYAAEMGMEHHLGLTCDPVNGLVQIPCIERNAFAAKTALDCADYSIFSGGFHLISFDEVINVMKTTGRDLPSVYRETSIGGLAAVYKNRIPKT